MKLSGLSAPHPSAFSPTQAATDAPEAGAPTQPTTAVEQPLSGPLGAHTGTGPPPHTHPHT